MIDSSIGGRSHGNQVSQEMGIEKLDNKLKEQMVEQDDDDDNDVGRVNVVVSRAGHCAECLMTLEFFWAGVSDSDG